MQLKHFGNYIFKRIWNPNTYNYQSNIKKAFKNTEALGLKPCSSFEESSVVYDDGTRQVIINEIITYFYNEKKYNVGDIALKCFWVSQELQAFLKNRFNIVSHITTGNVYGAKLRINYESLTDLKKRLTHSIQTPIKSHTWLTLENHTIIDLTIPANMYLEFNDPNFLYKVGWVTIPFDKNSFVYEPLIMGYEYFEKIKVKPMAYLIQS